MKTAFLYSDDFGRFDYGATHPLKPFRLKLTHEMIKAYGLLDLPQVRVVEARPASDNELLLFHDRKYVEVLKSVNAGASVPGAGVYGLGPGDNPVFPGLYDWSVLVTGASLQAADLVDSGEVDIAFNISGGLHHALSARASGFCYINDPVVAIMHLLQRGRKVAYIDIDAHHGDGVQDAFYSSNRVLTISIHESGRLLFPGTGFEQETGSGEGTGFSVNVPLPPYADDELFLLAFREVVPPLVGSFKPDIVVTQLGVDTFDTDPLTHLSFTTNGFCEAVKAIREIAPRWVALGGGGYNISNVARAWTLAWGIMINRDVPDEIPAEFLETYRSAGFSGTKLRDAVSKVQDPSRELMIREIMRIIKSIHEEVLPKIR